MRPAAMAGPRRAAGNQSEALQPQVQKPDIPAIMNDHEFRNDLIGFIPPLPGCPVASLHMAGGESEVHGGLLAEEAPLGIAHALGLCEGFAGGEQRSFAARGPAVGIAGLRIDACVEGLEVSRNTIDTTGQEAIWIGPRCTADSKVHANVLRHPACQLAFANTAAIKIEGLNCTVTDNTIDSGHVSINVTSSVAAPGVSVDPATTTITLYSGVTALASKNYAGLTFGDVAEWVRTNANWDATMYGEPNAPYVSATDYSPNNVVTHGGRVYRNIARSKFIAPVASWSAATTYALNDKVLCAGSIYVSLAAGNVGNDPLMTPAKWSAYYPPAWSAGTSYAAGDTVSYAGGFMRSLQPGNLGNDPGSSPTFWTWGALLYWVPMAIDGAAMLPAALMWLSLSMIISYKPKRWLTPPPIRTASFSSNLKLGVVLRVSSTLQPVPATASAYCRDTVAVADKVCNKFNAVRSPVRIV